LVCVVASRSDSGDNKKLIRRGCRRGRERREGEKGFFRPARACRKGDLTAMSDRPSAVDARCYVVLIGALDRGKITVSHPALYTDYITVRAG
jgi:hypothetical protein